MLSNLKIFVRKIAAILFYQLYYKFRKTWDQARDGSKLKNGITAVVSAKNEDFLISLCLKSLIGVVDQVVCIDNGSEDDTLILMKQFKEQFSDLIEVDIVSMPNALLGDCRNKGLEKTRYKWHLRWDADMICRTSGTDSMKLLRKKVLENDTPRTIQLPRINLRGDFSHSKIGGLKDPGEPILMRFSKDIQYIEDGKFDIVKVPFYYKMQKETKYYYFHCEGLKSDHNLIYRHQYFDWRELYNSFDDAKRPENIQTFKSYVDYVWPGFDTKDWKSTKWRHQRLVCSTLIKVTEDDVGDFPDVIKECDSNKKERFNIIYKNLSPYIRLDKNDIEMLNYQPTKDDLDWELINYNILYQK